ncbi:hypothetical protein HMPREF9628_01499 [Peptoanaerobacter stomatis]|uniref:Uncharacterized protein n=1 Tax=Peptoanaerobacter stomatis TaxID=796937 RepID=G9XCC2_9FIRM|nr:hypothetical protein [Peptoanaerobacter stomatis]EHL19419.1 hypothetical protein HMPREF9628_01499 [Peptoanaerobacter stomatis]
MQYTAKDIIKECNDRNIHLYHLAIEDEMNKNNVSEEYIRAEFYKMLDVMGKSSSNFLEKESVTNMGMIDGFAKKMNDYYKKESHFVEMMLQERWRWHFQQ